LPGPSGVGGQSCGDVGAPTRAPSHKREHQIATRGERLRGGPAAHLTAVLVQRPALDGGGHQALLREVVIVGDGATWIWDEVAASFGCERTEIVDWYHASEYLGTRAAALWGEGTTATAQWRDHAKHLLWRHGPTPLLELLTDPGAAADPRGPPRAPARARLLPHPRPPHAVPRVPPPGLPCGSGAIESGARHVVQLRMKHPGQR